ncbi:hypothetical protein UFOVP941_48 [uncultured Caudovirales phage]|uniref:Uncharacterized protein n=1 Tax=uncultured Caudovirales phage TaxID=2100421 RepID=A0A6J5RZR5_9CAUD|nr:hypothetical protein UFOVP941_48 [uncultured Caudovirales phage]CAB4202825.1 hypothetical protein UFOVP1373_43 [uncultured Caudovirales phage]
MKNTQIEKQGEPILSGTFGEMKQKVENYFNGNGCIYRNSTCRTLYVCDKSNGYKSIIGYILKQENRVWNLYKTNEI